MFRVIDLFENKILVDGESFGPILDLRFNYDDGSGYSGVFGILANDLVRWVQFKSGAYFKYSDNNGGIVQTPISFQTGIGSTNGRHKVYHPKMGEMEMDFLCKSYNSIEVWSASPSTPIEIEFKQVKEA